jgi:uncharacterized circularly permuted ATP-grasp superfamily protein/uncharacterized alpha-E superfamily protein
VNETAEAAPDLRALVERCPAPAGHYDEARDARGLRDHWRAFLDHTGLLGREDLSRAAGVVASEIYENGVTYNVYAGAEGPSHAWGLDVLPMILPAAEWETLTRGLRQRARLLDAMAADIYGPQRLLEKGLLPPALVLGHPGFLRACHGVSLPPGGFLHLVAFDVARRPDGGWTVLGTRTQAPSGAGYALANRLIVSRLLRDAFRDLRVHMLAPFFRVLKQALIAAAPTTDGEAPRVVLLTPGPFNETYFEHAFLARYLGFALVEGADLTVRDERVFLKTLNGLRPVHAILRRLDDDYCDPVELRSDSALGVPGLVQAWRAGNVLVANAFGVGLLESEALYGFLPAIAQELLGEPLAIPSIATWWTGEAASLRDVSARFEEMVVKPAHPAAATETLLVQDLSPAEREAWRARVAEAPERYVLEEFLPLSHAPVWERGRLESRGVMLRVFLAADGRGDYAMLPGGLTRIAGQERLVSGQRGGGSKETWILSEKPIERVSLLPGRTRWEDVAHAERVVSSRAGEHLFWLGRYAERAQNGARLLRSVLSRLPDSDAFPPGLLDAFTRTCLRHGLVGRRPPPPADTQALERELIAGVFDREERLSLAFNVLQTVRSAAAVRERLSADNWRVLSRLARALAREDRPAGLADALEAIDRTIVSLVAVAGLEMSHMTRDDGWRFLGLGRLTERLLFVAATGREAAASADPGDPALLDWLLDLFDKTLTYRARYVQSAEWLPVMALLLFDRRNPRSVVFQLGKLTAQVASLPADAFGGLARELEAASAVAGDARGLLADRRRLRTFLTSCEALGLRLSDGLTLRYFGHVYETSRTTSLL